MFKGLAVMVRPFLLNKCNKVLVITNIVLHLTNKTNNDMKYSYIVQRNTVLQMIKINDSEELQKQLIILNILINWL